MSAEEIALLQDAEKKVYGGDFKSALPILEDYLKTNPKNLDALDLYVKAAMDKGDSTLAIKALKHAISIDPKTSHRWMDLGQIQSGVTALKCYRQGVSAMENQLKKAGGVDAKNCDGLRREIASGFASIAELFMTDLCDEPGAEQECEKALASAMRASTQSATAQYGCANLRFIQGRSKDAEPHLKACVHIIEKVGDDGELTYEFKMSVAELCLEMGKAEEAADIVERLLSENDRIVQVWYFAALCYNALNEVDIASQYLTRAVDMLKKSPEPDLMHACENLKKEIFIKIKNGSLKKDDVANEKGTEGDVGGMEMEAAA